MTPKLILLTHRSDAGRNLDIIADTPQRGAVIGGLKEIIVHTASEALELIKLGESNRHYGRDSTLLVQSL